MNKLRVIKLEECASTNDELKNLVLREEADFVLLLAAKQSAGRGRGEGAGFFSPAGGLYMSLLLPAGMLSEGMALSAAAAVAVCDVLAEYGLRCGIKWVNDIMWQGKKLGGILCEQVRDAAGRERVVVGIGLNIRRQSFPPELRARAVAADLDADTEQLAKQISSRLYALCSEGLSSEALWQRYRELSVLLGRRIVYLENGEEYPAQVLDIERSGALLVLTEQGTRSLSSGRILRII